MNQFTSVACNVDFSAECSGIVTRIAEYISSAGRCYAAWEEELQFY